MIRQRWDKRGRKKENRERSQMRWNLNAYKEKNNKQCVKCYKINDIIYYRRSI